jgi:membrane protein DedA with SNARE-associated domain
MNVVGSVIGWLGDHTYPVVFVGTLIDASGLPFPGRLLLITAGALAGTGRRSVVIVILLGIVGATLMDHVWYWGGAWQSERVLGLYRRLNGWSRVYCDAARDCFTRYGAATIVIGRFSTSVRILAWPFAAAHGVGYVKFLLLDLCAAGLWAALWVLLGWTVGERAASGAETAGTWFAIAGAVVLAVAVTPIAMRLWRWRGSTSEPLTRRRSR